MCDCPIRIKNPNFAPAFEHQHFHTSVRDNITKYSALKYPLDSYIEVPCGNCDSCRKLSQLYMVQRFREHSKGKWVIFGTCTYQNSALPWYRCTFENGETFEIPFADFRDFRLMIKRIRKDHLFSRPFTYWCTSEYGSDEKHPDRAYKSKHRPHFHYFIFVDKLPDDTFLDGESLAFEWEDIFKSQWKRNVSKSTKKPHWIPLSKFLKYPDGTGTYDVHLISEFRGKSKDPADAIFYACAYTLHYDKWCEKMIQLVWNNVDLDTYKEFKRLFRPHCSMSRSFGISPDTESYIRECIDWSIGNTNFFCYVNPDGSSVPLCRYYRVKFLDLRSSLRMNMKQPERIIFTPDGEMLCNTQVSKNYTRQDMKNLYLNHWKFEKICTNLRKNHFTYDFDE